jgi:hypothetical protein
MTFNFGEVLDWVQPPNNTDVNTMVRNPVISRCFFNNVLLYERMRFNKQMQLIATQG